MDSSLDVSSLLHALRRSLGRDEISHFEHVTGIQPSKPKFLRGTKF